MKRTDARELAVRLVFAANEPGSFLDREHYETLSDEDRIFGEFPDDRQLEYISTLLSLVKEHSEEIDLKIKDNLKGWSFDRVSSTALAVMRVAVCEMLYMDDVPNASAINAAVEICKGYDEPQTVSFVNGVLGSVSRTLQG